MRSRLGLEDVLKARNRAWVLSSWQVVVDEYAKMGTEIKIMTVPYEFKGFMGMRNFVIEDTEGKKNLRGQIQLDTS